MGKGGYGLTYQEVYEMENLTIEAKAIYGMLCSYAGSKAMAYPSVDFICDKLKISRTRFYKHMNLLVGAGVVKKEQRKNENQSFSGNVYVLVPNLQNIQMPCTENEYAGNASTGNEETNINTFNINTLKSKTEYREVMEAFNAICVSYPKVKSLSEARKKAIRARLRTYSIDDLRKAFEAEKEEERKPHNKDQIYKTLDGKFAVEFEKLFGKGACKKVFGVQKPSYTLYLEFFDKLNDLFEEWIKKI